MPNVGTNTAELLQFYCKWNIFVNSHIFTKIFIVLYIQRRFRICLWIKGVTCWSFNGKNLFCTVLNIIYNLSIADKFLKIAAFLHASNQACFSSTKSAYRILFYYSVTLRQTSVFLVNWTQWILLLSCISAKLNAKICLPSTVLDWSCQTFIALT